MYTYHCTAYKLLILIPLLKSLDNISAGGDEGTDTENFKTMLEQLNSVQSAWGLFLQAAQHLQNKQTVQTIQLCKQGTVCKVRKDLYGYCMCIKSYNLNGICMTER